MIQLTLQKSNAFTQCGFIEPIKHMLKRTKVQHLLLRVTVSDSCRDDDRAHKIEPLFIGAFDEKYFETVPALEDC